MFAPKSLVPEEPSKLYEHGYTPEQVAIITANKKELERRNLSEVPVTLEEFKDIVVPYQRIQRTEIFNLNPEKEKKVRVVKEKVVKIKKLTKKQIGEKVTEIVFKLARSEELTEEEQVFFKEHTTNDRV
jgi:hypothetical protein